MDRSDTRAAGRRQRDASLEVSRQFAQPLAALSRSSPVLEPLEPGGEKSAGREPAMLLAALTSCPLTWPADVAQRMRALG